MRTERWPHHASGTAPPPRIAYHACLDAAATPADPATLAVRIERDPSRIDAAAWDALVDARPDASPFMRLAFLQAAHASDSATEETGWAPHFLLVEDAGRLVAACALWLKHHSYGEYVFDWAWADAYRRSGLDYYPKLLVAVPFTPVPGPRLLGADAAHRLLLLKAMEQIARDAGLSSAHVLFLDADDRAAAETAGWSMRQTVQFHWHNRAPEPWRDFTDYLASLQRDKRKKIQQERRRVAEAGVVFEALEGAAITDDDWDFFHACYVRTYAAHHSTPYLTRDFFRAMARTMQENWLLFVARRAGVRIAASLIALAPTDGVAYGRYWGATEHVSCLHFEACYYQPLAWCIARGYRRFEGGAQGEHKMARGLLPVTTASAHWLAHPRFARAVDDHLAREGEGIAAWLDELHDRDPFKPAP